MKKRKIVIISLSSLGILSSYFLCLVNSSFLKTEAYDYVTKSNLPTELYLGNNTNEQIKEYYAPLSSYTSEELKGTNLLKNLKTLLSTDQIYYSYDDPTGKTNAIWNIYEISDRDWSRSSASDIANSSSSTYISGASYNDTTKMLTGYKYGVTDPYMHILYIDRDYESGVTAWGNHGGNENRAKIWAMEREHIWPKSYGFNNANVSPSGGARGDLMHLWPGEGWTNGVHNNLFYGYVDKTKTSNLINCGDHELTDGNGLYSTTEYAHLNWKGTSLSKGSGTVFEPQDSDKGDIARAVFYMAARYNNFANSTGDFNSNEPNLYLNDDLYGSTGDSTYDTPYNLGLLHDLLEWHHQDPVDAFEIHRNNLLYNNYTNNRNPFIDYPEWADYIWGTPEANMTYSSPTGSVDLNKDVINGYKGPEEATSITASATKTYHPGETISKSDITVIDNLDNEINAFTFASDGYQFTYADALSGGTLTKKYFNISYGNLETTLEVNVSRIGYVPAENETIEFNSSNGDFSWVTATYYANKDDYTTTIDGITYSTTSSYRYNNMLSFYTTKNGSAYETASIFRNTTPYDKRIVSITAIDSGSATIDPTIEYSHTSLDDSWSTSPGDNSYYFRIRYNGTFTGYVDISNITINLVGDETAVTLSNYIMYEDVVGQCLSKYDVAEDIFVNLASSERSLFMTSLNYVISEARTRLQAWAKNQGKTIEYVNGDYHIESQNIISAKTNQTYLPYIVLTLSISFIISLSFYAYFFLKRKRED